MQTATTVVAAHRAKVAGRECSKKLLCNPPDGLVFRPTGGLWAHRRIPVV
jgi:hypothetical protein